MPTNAIMGNSRGANAAHARRVVSKTAGTALVHAVLIVGAIFMALPFVWMILTSLKDDSEVFTYSLQWLPSKLNFDGYKEVWTEISFARMYLNSFIVAGGITICQLITSALAGYAFARLDFPGRDTVFMIYLSAMMIPHQATVIPSFILVRNLGMVDKYSALILPFAAGPFGAFMLRQFFLGMPRSLEEAAIIDGCSRFGVLRHVVLPLCKPAMVTLGLFQFMFAWNDFMWPLIVTNKMSMRTLQVGLALLRAEASTNWPMLMAATVLATVPVLVAFLAAQRQFIESIAFTGLKY
ncbi:MAG: carbohydrate ABC transporter permease [Clostridia bacterium]|nr:carbohydrate ABC transporter permease [Clostridia bacterium]